MFSFWDVTQVQLSVTVKSQIWFDRTQFAGGAKNLQDQRVVVIYPQNYYNVLIL